MLDRIADHLKFEKIDFRKGSEESARDLKDSSAIGVAVLNFFVKQVDVFVREHLLSAYYCLIPHIYILRCLHDKARVDEVVSILKLINILHGLHFFHFIEVKNHTIIPLCNLDQIVIEEEL